MGMFGALAAVLMLFEVPLPFIAPSFYGLDISEVPVLVGTFAMGPVAGAVMEGVKILVKLLLKPTSTGFVGEFANIVIGCSMVVPAGMIYRLRKTKKGSIEAMAVVDYFNGYSGGDDQCPCNDSVLFPVHASG